MESWEFLSTTCSGISFWPVGIIFASFQHLLHLQPPFWWGGMRNRKTLTLCKPCLATAKISLPYQHYCQHKTQTQPQLPWRTLSQSNQPRHTALWWCTTGVMGHDGPASTLHMHLFLSSISLMASVDIFLLSPRGFVSLSLVLLLQPHYQSRPLAPF